MAIKYAQYYTVYAKSAVCKLDENFEKVCFQYSPSIIDTFRITFEINPWVEADDKPKHMGRLVSIVHCPLRWRYNGCDKNVSNHQSHDCLLNRLFGHRSKKTIKLRITGLCAGIHRSPVSSPHKGPVTRKMFPFDDVIMPSHIFKKTMLSVKPINTTLRFTVWHHTCASSKEWGTAVSQTTPSRWRHDIIRERMPQIFSTMSLHLKHIH